MAAATPPGPQDTTTTAAAWLDTAFESAKDDFLSKLPADVKADLAKFTTPGDVYKAAHRLQLRQAKSNRQDSLIRIQPLFEALREYSQVAGKFAQVKPEVLSLLWAPLKFLLRAAKTHTAAVEKIVEALAETGRNLPNFQPYPEVLFDNDGMMGVLCLFFEDLLGVYLVLVNFVMDKSLSMVIEALWPNVRAKLIEIQVNIIRHKALITPNVTLDDISRARRDRGLSLEEYDQLSKLREQQAFRAIREEVRPETYDEKLAGILQETSNGSAAWLYEQYEFKKWIDPIDRTARFLWLYGSPGAGKTYLAGNVIDRLQKSGQRVLFAFISHEQQSVGRTLAVLKSLLFQALEAVPSLQPTLLNASHPDPARLKIDHGYFEKLLCEVLAGIGPVFLVLDGLDNTEERGRLLSTIFDIKGKCIETKVFVSSRQGIERPLKQHATLVRMDKHNRQDMRLFVYSESDSLFLCATENPNMENRTYRQMVLHWLTPTDYAPTHINLRRRRQPGSGRWLLESDKFKTWITADRQMLFCPGDPGVGKTFLSAIVIDHLHRNFKDNPDVGIAYIYCSLGRHSTETASDLVSNILKQLASARPSLPSSIQALYARESRPSLADISAALRSVAAEYSKVFVVVDALDECDSFEALLKQLLDLHSTAGVSVLATSRPVRDIVRKFNQFPSLHISPSSNDMEQYIGERMGELKVVEGQADLQKKNVAEISSAADGTFLFADVYLRPLHAKRTRPDNIDAPERSRRINSTVTWEAEIHSIFSEILPSPTEGSTISSSPTLGLMEDIKSDTLAILTKDEGLRRLFNETPKRITHERFQRNFLRLFRWFLSDIRKHSPPGGELHQAIRVLRYQSRNIASHICQEIFDLKAQSDSLSSLALQVPDKDGQLISFLENDSTIPETVDVPKGELHLDDNYSGGESDEPETVQPDPIPLGDLETIILDSISFLAFRERYRAFLFPRPDPPPQDRVAALIPQYEVEDSRIDITSAFIQILAGIVISLCWFQDVCDVFHNTISKRSRPYIEYAISETLAHIVGFLFLLLSRGVRGILDSIIDVYIFPAKGGYRRLRWRCSCGTLLCADFDNSHPEALQELWKEMHHVPQVVVKTSQRKRKAYKTIYVNHTEAMRQLSQEFNERNPTGPGAGRQGPAPGTPHSVTASLGTAALQHSSTTRAARAYDYRPPVQGIHLLSTPPPGVNPPPPKKQFFEVCINTGRHAVTLKEIDLDYVTSDGDLFQQIWDRYSGTRGSSIRKLFLKPRDVHFVKFLVSQGYDDLAGIHGKPSEYPPQEEIDKRRYHYRCPKILMPANVFLHLLHKASRGSQEGHLESTWLQRLPKKLDAGILGAVRRPTQTWSAIPLVPGPTQPAQGSEAEDDDDIVFGWGVHILEGPNQAGLCLVVVVGITVAFVVSCLVLGLAKTQEQGFGVGQFLLAILACGMPAAYFALEER